MTSSSPGSRRKAGAAAHPSGRTGGKPAGATTARRELVENEIYEQAIRLFAERGFAGTSLQDIADALGITRPALYYYVKSKDELLAKLAADVAGGSAAQITEVAARPDLDAVGKIREIARLNVVRVATQPERFRLLIRNADTTKQDAVTAVLDRLRSQGMPSRFSVASLRTVNREWPHSNQATPTGSKRRSPV